MTTAKKRSESKPLDVTTGAEEKDHLLSIVIAVRDPERAAPMDQLYKDYKEQFENLGLAYEFIFALEGQHTALINTLRLLKQEGEPIRILVLTRWYGGATVLSEGFERASGALLLTLPAYHQIEPSSIPSLLSALEDNDMVVAQRSPRVDGLFTRLQVKVFHALLRGLTGSDFHDLGCSVVAFRREMLDAVDMYGNQHRFFPVLAAHYGFRVTEVEAPQTDEDTFQNHFSLFAYVNRFLDLLSILFLTKFTRKPLRFFGAASLVSFFAGSGITINLTIQRLFMGVPLQDKPMLILGVLLIVLGVLLFSIGLIGEMLIFTNSDKLKEYTVEELVD